MVAKMNLFVDLLALIEIVPDKRAAGSPEPFGH
jgi:hypothetical protein